MDINLVQGGVWWEKKINDTLALYQPCNLALHGGHLVSFPCVYIFDSWRKEKNMQPKLSFLKILILCLHGQYQLNAWLYFCLSEFAMFL